MNPKASCSCLPATFSAALMLFLGEPLFSAEPKVTPEIQNRIDAAVPVIESWAKDPVIVQAVQEQNEKGPIAGMDNLKWKALLKSDSTVKSFQENRAGRFLAAKLLAGAGEYSEAFLSAAQGEKAAFVTKPTSYNHAGQGKFDVPMKTRQFWVGPLAFDESSKTYAVQISAPVIDDGQAIGVLTVGLKVSGRGR